MKVLLFLSLHFSKLDLLSQSVFSIVVHVYQYCSSITKMGETAHKTNSLAYICKNRNQLRSPKQSIFEIQFHTCNYFHLFVLVIHIEPFFLHKPFWLLLLVSSVYLHASLNHHMPLLLHQCKSFIVIITKDNFTFQYLARVLFLFASVAPDALVVTPMSILHCHHQKQHQIWLKHLSLVFFCCLHLLEILLVYKIPSQLELKSKTILRPNISTTLPLSDYGRTRLG